MYLEPLFDWDPAAGTCITTTVLVQVKDFRGPKNYEKQLKQNKTDVKLYVFLGKVYKLQNDTKKEKETYDKALKELSPYPHL